ncbi:MAG: DegT/DnrJ/EryC1/StrS family aminotransferase [bacterium]|nr:DegT/DnrJ/EryC1/StrS family aminotransferase [bacterium]
MRETLCQTLGAERCDFYGTGKRALTAALSESVAREQGGKFVLVSAYGCPDVPASVVAAGFKPWLVDVDPQTIDLLADSIPDDVARDSVGIVLSNLYGMADSLPMGGSQYRALPSDIVVIDDASQAALTHTDIGTVGLREGTRLGVLSFGRGKSLSAYGGGAVVGRCVSTRVEVAQSQSGKRNGQLTSLGVFGEFSLLVRAYILSSLERPELYGILSRVPFLGLGQANYPDNLGPEIISRFQSYGLLAMIHSLDSRREVRRRHMRIWEEELGGISQIVLPHLNRGESGVTLSRLPLLFPSRDMRDRLLPALVAAGASVSYPIPLHRFSQLDDCVPEGIRFPGADRVADTIMTLPVHEKVSSGVIKKVAKTIRGVAAAWI